MLRCPSLAGWPLVLVLLLAGATTSLDAQSSTITLRSVVTGNDESIPQGAQIEVRSQETGGVRIGLTDAGGRYRVLGLAPGVYDVLVRAIGYRQHRREGVRLVLGERAILDVTLEPGAVELAPIIVSAERPFEIDRGDVSTAILRSRSRPVGSCVRLPPRFGAPLQQSLRRRGRPT